MLGISVGNKSTWMYQKRFCKFPVTVIIHWTYLLNILKSVSVNVSINPASHIFPIDNRLADVMLLRILQWWPPLGEMVCPVGRFLMR